MKIHDSLSKKTYHFSYFFFFMIFIIFLFLITLWLNYYFLNLLFLFLTFIPIVVDAIQDLFKKNITTELFLVLATPIALFAHEERAMAIVLLIMLIAKYIEQLIEDKTTTAIESLMKLIPNTVTVLMDHHEKKITLLEVTPGMNVLIKTGEQIPIDGTILDGQAGINESFLTGESIPHFKGIADVVFAGTFVESGSIVIRVDRIGASTNFGKISQLLQQAELEKKANIITLSKKVAFIIVPLLIIFFFIVWIITHNPSLVATLLIFGSPIELTLVTPLAILAGTAAAFGHGILVKGGKALEQLASVDTLIFDKTGTLTLGEPQVVAIESVNNMYTAQDILKWAAMLEKRSGHILAKAILQKARTENITIPDPQNYESITGHGIVATYNNQRYMLGSEHFIKAPEHGNIPISPSVACTHEGAVDTTFYLSIGTNICGRICVRDTLRPDAKKTIEKLRVSGINHIILLSGDKTDVAKHIASKLGIGEAYGDVEPDEKLALVKKIQQSGRKVAMIGDGINDAPALKQADVGIAMGAMGMEPAIQAADIVLMTNDLHGIIFIHALSKKIVQRIKQNIFLGFGLIHVVGIILTLYGLVNPIQAALSHAFSDVFMVFNSARLIRFRIKK